MCLFNYFFVREQRSSSREVARTQASTRWVKDTRTVHKFCKSLNTNVIMAKLNKQVSNNQPDL